jgi:hypothetical protein
MQVVVLFGSIYAGCSTACVHMHVGCITGRARTYTCHTTDRSRICCTLISVEDCCLISVDVEGVR